MWHHREKEPTRIWEVFLNLRNGVQYPKMSRQPQFTGRILKEESHTERLDLLRVPICFQLSINQHMHMIKLPEGNNLWY